MSTPAFRVEPHREPRIALDIETAVGSPPSRAEVARRFTVAEGFLARDAHGVPVGSATLALYPDVEDEGLALAWLGGISVLEPWRGRGVGRALLDAALARADELGARSVGAAAAEDGRAMYAKAGFRAVARAARWEQVLVPPVPRTRAHSVHPISLSEAMELRDFDAARFGAKRLPLLLALLHEQPWRAFMSRDRATGETIGFAMGHERGIGPVVADAREVAFALLAACVSAGAPPAVLAPEENARVTEAFRAAGYASGGRGCTLMARGADWPARRDAIFGLATWALG